MGAAKVVLAYCSVFGDCEEEERRRLGRYPFCAVSVAAEDADSEGDVSFSAPYRKLDSPWALNAPQRTSCSAHSQIHPIGRLEPLDLEDPDITIAGT